MELSAARIVRRGFDALNAGDVERVVAIADPAIEWRPLFAGEVEGRHYIGRDGVREWFGDGRQWTTEYTIDELIERGNAVVVHGTVAAEGGSSGVLIDMPVSWAIEVRDGLVTRMEAFRDRAEAEAMAR